MLLMRLRESVVDRNDESQEKFNHRGLWVGNINNYHSFIMNPNVDGKVP